MPLIYKSFQNAYCLYSKTIIWSSGDYLINHLPVLYQNINRYTIFSFVQLSLDLHPARDMVASGQRAGRTRKTQAHIRIWSTESLLTLYVFGMGEFEVGVSAVSFSQLVSRHFSILLFVLRSLTREN